MDINSAGQAVLETLARATSQNTELLKPAEHQLKEWETRPGFYSILMSIFSNHSIDVNVRWLAVLYFKNGIDRYWRKTAPSAIAEEEKTILRQQLIAIFNEPIAQVATQLAVLIGKVARMDWPRQWPELIPALLNAIKSENELYQHRALLTLNHVTKSLASKRLTGDKRIFQEVTSGIFSFILNLWNSHTEIFLQLSSQQDPGMEAALERSLLSLKVLRKLLIHGFKDVHKSEDTIILLKLVFERLKTLLPCRKSLMNNMQIKEKCEKFIILLTKVLLDSQEYHPFSYVQFIRPSLEFAVTYVFTPIGEGLLFERFIVQCLNLVKGILMSAEYRPAKFIEETNNPATLEAHCMKMEFFTAPILVEICQRLLSHYFLLTTEDLRLWENDPEDFAINESGDSWKFSLRPSTQSLFLVLFHEFRETLIPVLLELVHNHQGICDPDNLSAILCKDAVYNAVGLAPFELYDEIDFDQWLSTSLIDELKNKHPRYKIIRRRVIWLIGRWVGVKLALDLRPLLYEAIKMLLSEEVDLVVKLTAASTLKVAIDDFEFNKEQFQPYLESIFSLLFQLLKQVSGCDTKMHVLHVLSFMIECMGSLIKPCMGGLLQYLPLLWEESTEHNMLRCAILNTLVHLVNSMGSSSIDIYQVLLPVIQLSTDVNQDMHVYLLEDGLDLWFATLKNAPVINNNLMQLFKNMPALLELGSENLRTALHIIKAYVLLAPKDFLEKYGEIIANACTNLVSDLRSEGIVLVLKLVELVLKAFPTEGLQLFQFLMPWVIKSTTEDQEFPMVLSMYLSIVSRMIISNQTFFSSIVDVVATEKGQQNSELFGRFLEVWLTKQSNVTQPERRKVMGLALASLITSNSSVVFDHFCGVLLALVEILHDICKSDSGTQLDSLVICENEVIHNEIETEHDKRCFQLSMKDPVYTVSLKDYTHSQLRQCQEMLGSANFEQLMATIDIETMQQLQEFLQ